MSTGTTSLPTADGGGRPGSAGGSARPSAAAVRPGRYGLWGMLRSEWTKLRTVRSTMWSLGLVVVLSVGIGALASAEARLHYIPGSQIDPTRLSLVGVFFAQLVVGVLGILVMSGEYGTGTIRATLAATPRRHLVLLAKVVVFGAVSLVVSEVVAFASYLLGQALLGAPAPHTTLASPGALRAVVGAGLYLCVLGLVALGLATIIRHTAGAIGAFVGVLLVVPIIVAALPSSIGDHLSRYLPDAIGRTLISYRTGSHAFTPWVGFAVLCAYAAGLLVIGAVVMARRDA